MDADGFVTTHLPGREVAVFPPGALPAEFFDRLMALVEAIHRRGVVHLDLRQRRNILVEEPALLPRVVDFGGALRVPARGRVAAFLRDVDRAGALKFKARHCRGALSPAERRLLSRMQLARWFWPFNINRDRWRARRVR
ncbi:MAG: hypothetical protein HY719_07265 [Planctomycetes bacterium]|nr:hypothetical protein [Planctomycetota bacterium]